MGKLSKRKKTKIPKLTEAQYAAYVSSLKEGAETQPSVGYPLDAQQASQEKEK